MLSVIEPELKSLGYSIVCITWQKGPELDAFFQESQFNGNLYRDESKASYDAFGVKTPAFSKWKIALKSWFSAQAREERRRLKLAKNLKNASSRAMSYFCVVNNGKITWEQAANETIPTVALLKALGADEAMQKAAEEKLKSDAARDYRAPNLTDVPPSS